MQDDIAGAERLLAILNACRDPERQPREDKTDRIIQHMQEEKSCPFCKGQSCGTDVKVHRLIESLPVIDAGVRIEARRTNLCYENEIAQLQQDKRRAVAALTLREALYDESRSVVQALCEANDLLDALVLYGNLRATPWPKETRCSTDVERARNGIITADGQVKINYPIRALINRILDGTRKGHCADKYRAIIQEETK